jgi:hypothetical protein
MHPLRKFRDIYIENGDQDLEGHTMGEINTNNIRGPWLRFLNNFVDYSELKHLYVVDSTRKLIPPHRPETFTLHKGLLLFHVSIHDPSVDFKYPKNEPFFSVTPSHGLGIAFSEKRYDVANCGHRARLMIFVLRRDLSTVDNCGDCNRLRESEAAVAGYNNHGNEDWSNLNEIRLFKKTETEVEECIKYVTEYDLTTYILEKNGYVNYNKYDELQLFVNREVIFNLPITYEFYIKSGWRPITSQMSPMSFMPFLLSHEECKNLPRLFVISLFAVNQIWILGKYDAEELENNFDIAILILYNRIPRLIFMTDYLPGREDEHLSEKRLLRIKVEKIYPRLL